MNLSSAQEKGIQQLIAIGKAESDWLAIILGGSLAKGLGSANSDLDVLILLTDAAHKVRSEKGALHYYNKECCDYEGGYVDGKFINRRFLEQVAEKGSEPARSAFLGAEVVWQRAPEERPVGMAGEVPDIEQLIKEIVRYPVEKKAENQRRFYAQLQGAQWYIGEGDKYENDYLRQWAASRLVLFGCRLILAHNEMLYPYHKWMLAYVARAPQKPEGLRDHIDALLKKPCKETADAFTRLVLDFHDWPEPQQGWPAQFILDSELNWMEHPAPVEDI